MTEALAEEFWPGPLTMIFRKNEMVPYGPTGGLVPVAVRMPEHKIALELIKALLHLYTKVFCNTPSFVRWTEDYLRYGTHLLESDPSDREVITSCHSLFDGLKEAIKKGVADGSVRCGLNTENVHNAIASLLLGEIQRCAGPFAKLYNANDSNEKHMALLEEMIIAYLSPAANPFAASI